MSVRKGKSLADSGFLRDFNGAGVAHLRIPVQLEQDNIILGCIGDSDTNSAFSFACLGHIECFLVPRRSTRSTMAIFLEDFHANNTERLVKVDGDVASVGGVDLKASDIQALVITASGTFIGDIRARVHGKGVKGALDSTGCHGD